MKLDFLFYQPDRVATIKEVLFGILSPERIRAMSSCEVFRHITMNQKSQPGTQSDSRLGVIDRGRICQSCLEDNNGCPGHMGHTNLAKPVFHPLYLNTVLKKLLTMICFSCSRLLISFDGDNAARLNSIRSKVAKIRFNQLKQLIDDQRKKTPHCPHCGATAHNKIRPHPQFLSKLMMSYETGTGSNKKIVERQINPEICLAVLKGMTDEDIYLAGFDPQLSRPEWMIWTVLPFPPIAVRPPTRLDIGRDADDDLTIKLNDILKTNNNIKLQMQKTADQLAAGQLTAGNEIQANYGSNEFLWESLQFHVTTYIDNESTKKTSVHRSGRPLKALVQRIKTKEGRVRGNLMGKRVDDSGRTVVTPDNNINIDEIGIPRKIATNLVKPVCVTPFNIDQLQQYVYNGMDEYPGAKYVVPKGNRYKKPLKLLSRERRQELKLQYGDVVFRNLLDGDWVLVNRQPSLHRMSMMAHKIVILKGETFRLNVNAVKPYNADFDGDEINIHVPQSLEAENEMAEISHLATQIISPKDALPVMGLVQDGLLGLYLFNHDGFLTVKNAMKMANDLNLKNSLAFSDVQGHLIVSSREILNYTLPKVTMLNKDGGSIATDSLQYGKIAPDGSIDTAGLKDGKTGLIHVTWNDYGPEVTRSLFDNLARIATNWLLISGFSVGILDCIPNVYIKDRITNTIKLYNNATQYLVDYQQLRSLPQLSLSLASDSNYQKLLQQLSEMIKSEGYTYNNKPAVEQLLAQIYYPLLVNRLRFEFYRLIRFSDRFDANRRDNLINENCLHVLQYYLIPNNDKPPKPAPFFSVIQKLQSDLLPIFQELMTDFLEQFPPRAKNYHLKLSDLVEWFKLQSPVNLLGDNDSQPSEDLIRELEALVAFIGTLLYIVPGSRDMSERIEEKLYELTQGSTVIVNSVINSNTGVYQYQGLDNKYFKYLGNGFKTMYLAKSKGDVTNIGQIAGLLGQQDLEGKRAGNFFYRRSLPHFPKDSIEPKYRGYVQNSFLEGLQMLEYFSHAQAGRLNQIDKSIKSVTPESKIIIHEDGRLVQTTIGEWIDQKLEASPNQVIHQPEQEMESLILSNKVFIPTCDSDGYVTWGEITAVTRHDPGLQLYEIKTLGGREVIVTESKSLLIWNPALQKFCQTSTPEVVVGDLMPVTRSLPAQSLATQTLATQTLATQSLATQSLATQSREGQFPVEQLFGKEEQLFGKYDNNRRGGQQFGQEEFQQFENFLFSSEIAFQMSSDFLEGLIETVFTVNNNEPDLSFTSTSEQLINGLIMLLNLHNYSCVKSHTTTSDGIDQYGCHLREFGDCQNHVILDRIVEINLIDVKKYPKVYDLTVPSTLNFGLANGLHVVDTAETGYLQRRIIKMLEPLVNCYDGTIRNSSGNIIQKMYGGDGINPQHLEKVKLTLGQLESRYQLTTNDLQLLSQFNPTVSDASLLSNGDQLQYVHSLTKRFVKLFKGTSFDLSPLLDHPATGQLEFYANLPVNFERLTHNNYFRFNLSTNQTTTLTPDLMFRQIQALSERIEQNIVLNSCEHSLMFNLGLHQYLNIKQLLLEYHYTAEAFQCLLEDIYLKYGRSLMTPGESIGIVSAQSIGEPLTQMTLNKFHAAGVGKARSKLQGGVPRLGELLGLTKKDKMKTPSMSMPVSEYYSLSSESINSNLNIDMNIVNGLKGFKFKSLVSLTQIAYDPDGIFPQVNPNKPYAMSEVKDPETYPWLISFQLKTNIKREFRNDMIQNILENHLRKRKNSNDKFKVIVSYDGLTTSQGKLNNFVNIRVKSSLFENKGDNILGDLTDLKNELLKINIKGQKDISEVFIERENGKKVIFTLGSNLSSIIDNPICHSIVDINQLTSNVVLEIEQLYGIEAARYCFINEMFTTFDNKDINLRQIELLADNMSHLGELLRVNRFGVKRGNNEPLHRASFEETTKQFIDSSIHNERDPMKGPSANIMFGQLINSGTNFFKIMLDIDKLVTLDPVKQQTDVTAIDPFNTKAVSQIRIQNNTQLAIESIVIADLFVYEFRVDTNYST